VIIWNEELLMGFEMCLCVHAISLCYSCHYSVHGNGLYSDYNCNKVEVEVEVKVQVTLRLAIYRQSVRFGAKHLEDHDHRFFQLNRSIVFMTATTIANYHWS
jgi:hypothetical protein